MNEITGTDNDTAVDKLERQNEKLRKELKQLTKALEASKKKQKGRVPQASELTEDKETTSVNAKIKKFKEETLRMKRELEGNLNISKITDLENHSIFLAKRIAEFESEHESFKKIEKEQQKALNSAQNSNTYPEKISKLKDDIRLAKEKYKELSTKHKQDEKIHRAQHEKCVDLEDKCRKLYDMIKKKKSEEEELKKKYDGEVPQGKEITETDIQKLEEKIKQTEQMKIDEENKIKKRIKDIETQVREGKHNLEMMKIKLKEKDQECRLSLLKIKELRKAMKHNQLKPLVRNSTPKKLSPSLNSGSNTEKEKDMARYTEEEDGIIKDDEAKIENENFFNQQPTKEIQPRYEEKYEKYSNKEDMDNEENIIDNEENYIKDAKITPEAKKVDLSKPNFIW